MTFDDWRVRWIGVPLVLGSIAAITLPSNNNRALYAASQSAPIIQLTGELAYQGGGKTQPVVETRSGPIPVNCWIDRNRSWCLPDLAKRKIQATVDAYQFDSRNWILSVASSDGATIVSRASQINRLRMNAKFEQDRGRYEYFLGGAVLGIIMSAMYALFLKIFNRINGVEK